MTDDEKLLAECRFDVYSNMAGNSVRITHIATGMVEVCGEEPSTLMNRRIALERLRDRLQR